MCKQREIISFVDLCNTLAKISDSGLLSYDIHLVQKTNGGIALKHKTNMESNVEVIRFHSDTWPFTPDHRPSHLSSDIMLQERWGLRKCFLDNPYICIDKSHEMYNDALIIKHSL